MGQQVKTATLLHEVLLRFLNIIAEIFDI